MIWITLARIAIWLTFLLLAGEGLAAVIFLPRFYWLYVRKHQELEVRVEALERRLAILKEPPR